MLIHSSGWRRVIIFIIFVLVSGGVPEIIYWAVGRKVGAGVTVEILKLISLGILSILGPILFFRAGRMIWSILMSSATIVTIAAIGAGPNVVGLIGMIIMAAYGVMIWRDAFSRP